MTNMIHMTPALKAAYPKARFGVLIVKGVSSQSGRTAMDKIVTDEISQVKARYSDYERKVALATEPLCHYSAYYKKWGKTYHVLGQLESILLKGKGIPPVGVAVEAMFLAEVKNLLLTAGHDLDLTRGDLTVDIAQEPISYQGMSGKEQQLAINDMYVADGQGVLSSVIGGPDHRTRITEATRNALYFVYGVDGVTEPQIREHLQTIATYLSQATEGAAVQSLDVY